MLTFTYTILLYTFSLKLQTFETIYSFTDIQDDYDALEKKGNK